MKLFNNHSSFPFGEVMLAVLENIPEKPETISRKAVEIFHPGRQCRFTDTVEVMRWCLFGAHRTTFLRFLTDILGGKGLLVSNKELGLLYADPADIILMDPSERYLDVLFGSSEWRIRRGGRIIDVIPLADGLVEVRENTVRSCLERIQRDLADLKMCGFWPYESPARCSTEQVIVDGLADAEEGVGRAYAAFRSLRRGDTCSGAPCFSAVKINDIPDNR